MDDREYSEAIYQTKDLVEMICVGPVFGLGHGLVWVPRNGVSCPFCRGYVTTKEHFNEVGPHQPTPPNERR